MRCCVLLMRKKVAQGACSRRIERHIWSQVRAAIGRQMTCNDILSAHFEFIYIYLVLYCLLHPAAGRNSIYRPLRSVLSISPPERASKQGLSPIYTIKDSCRYIRYCGLWCADLNVWHCIYQLTEMDPHHLSLDPGALAPGWASRRSSVSSSVSGFTLSPVESVCHQFPANSGHGDMLRSPSVNRDPDSGIWSPMSDLDSGLSVTPLTDYLRLRRRLTGVMFPKPGYEGDLVRSKYNVSWVPVLIFLRFGGLSLIIAMDYHGCIPWTSPITLISCQLL